MLRQKKEKKPWYHENSTPPPHLSIIIFFNQNSPPFLPCKLIHSRHSQQSPQCFRRKNPSRPRLLSVLSRVPFSPYAADPPEPRRGRQHERLQNAVVTNMTANATQAMIMNLVPSIAEMPTSSPALLISETPFLEMPVAMALPMAKDSVASAARTRLMTIAPFPMALRRRVRTPMQERKERPESPLPTTKRMKTASRKLLR